MRKFTLTTALLAIAISSWGVQVNNIAGQLAQRITDHNITSLSVNGSMDARDFKFIADYLDKLTDVDLSNVDIVAYENLASPLIGNQLSFEAKTIPATSFFGKPLSHVVLPNDLVTIGFAAFAGCSNLAAINIPASIDSIGGYAFSATRLSQVNLPATITKMGEGAYSHCNYLTTVTVTNGNVGDYAFLGDANLNSVTIGAGVKKIGNGTFNGCTALKTITWGSASQLTSIGSEAFTLSSISNADLSAFNSLNSVGDWAYANTPIATAKLPQTVKKLGDGALYYARNINHFVLPSKVKKVGSYLLAGTSVSNNDVLNNTATLIGEYALYNLSQVQSVIIPAHVDKIGTKAMAGMTGLKLIQAKPTIVPELGDSVWAGVNQPLVELNAPVPEYKTAEQWKDFHVYQTITLGDVNADGLVNVSDITSLINCILDTPYGTFIFEAADLDKNNIINVSDVTAIINLILNGEITIIKRVGYTNTDDNVNIADLAISAGETRTIDINLNNELNYTAMQFDLHLPDGLELIDSNILTTDRSSGHQFTSSTHADGTIRLLGYSMDANDFAGNEGAVLRLTVKANNNLANDSEINIENAIFATRNGETYFGEGTKAQVINTSSVNDIAVKNAKVYAHDHVLVIENAQAATAQLITINGMVTNLVVEAGHNEYEGFEPGIYMVRIEGATYKVAIR